MKSITKREMTRQPSKLTSLRPGQSMRIEDREGGLIVARPKRQRMTVAEIEAEIDRIGEGAPAIDTRAFLQEGEA